MTINMQLLYSIGLSIVGYFVLMYLTTNLTGMVVRGFFRDPKLQEMKNDENTHDFIKKEIVRNDRADVIVTILFAILGVLFLYLLNCYLNIWAVIAALLLIFSRIPDLLWEIHTGKKVTKNDRPKGGVYAITDIVILVALPILWWSLYSFLSR